MKSRDGVMGLVCACVAAPAWAQCEPALLGVYESPRSPVRVVVEDGFVFTAMLRNGLEIIDATDPGNPHKVGGYDTGAYVVGLAKSGDLVVLTHDESLVLLDVRDPAAPVLLATHHGAGPAYDAEIVGDLAYIAAYTSGLGIVDIGDPANPTLVGAIDATETYGLAVSGGVAYLADGSGGLRTIDVSDPADPSEIGRLALPGRAWWVELAGSLAYVSTGEHGTQVVDISDPANPVLVGTFAGDTAVSAVDARRRIALVCNGAQLDMVDISAAPRLLGSVALPDSGQAVAIAGANAYVGAGPFEDALVVLDIGACLPCPADFDRDGRTDTRDVLAFLNAWIAAEPWADFDGDGAINTADVLAFLNAWNVGCP